MIESEAVEGKKLRTYFILSLSENLWKSLIFQGFSGFSDRLLCGMIHGEEKKQ